MHQQKTFDLGITTQGPTYPPSEVMDDEGNFIVIGRINKAIEGKIVSSWGAAIVSADSPTPIFGQQAAYNIKREFSINHLGDNANCVLYTLPLPLPCNNYPMLFAPEQNPHGDIRPRPSFPFHQAPIADLREEDGRKLQKPITLGDWVKAKGQCKVSIPIHQRSAIFEFSFSNLIPDSLYTIMSLREGDLDPERLTRPGPLGIPNVFITNSNGNAHYKAELPNPFPSVDQANRNRIINVIILWMSSQASYGGAIGLYGLGGDIHAQLKLQAPSFFEFTTRV